MRQLDKSLVSTRVLGKKFEIRSALNKRLSMKESPISNKIDAMRKQENKAKKYFLLSKKTEQENYKLTPEQMKKRQQEYNKKVGGYLWNGQV